jgi:hypothetical protein
MVADGRSGGAGGFGLNGLLLPPAEELLGSQVLALLACAGAPKANRRAATMPARARNAATAVVTIQPVDLVVEAVGVAVGVDMMMIFLSLWFGL